MVKTLAVCCALCLAAAAFARFHEAVADRPAPAHAFAADAGRVGARNATIDGRGVAPSSNDGNVGRPAPAEPGADKPSVVALDAATAGWARLFNH